MNCLKRHLLFLLALAACLANVCPRKTEDQYLASIDDSPPRIPPSPTRVLTVQFCTS